MSHVDIMVQVHSTLKTINTNTLRPVFHRFLSPRQRTLNMSELYQLRVPSFVATTLDKILQLPTIPVQSYLHRMVPLEPMMPKVIGVPYGMLCVARENVSGGDVVTNEEFIEPRPGDLILFQETLTLEPYYMRPLQPMEYTQDAYMDVIWFMANLENKMQ